MCDEVTPLAPCEYCNGAPTIESTVIPFSNAPDQTVWFAICQRCPSEGAWADNPALAAQLWNEGLRD